MHPDMFKEIGPPTWGLTTEIQTTAHLQDTKLYWYITVQSGGFGKVFPQLRNVRNAPLMKIYRVMWQQVQDCGDMKPLKDNQENF